MICSNCMEVTYLFPRDKSCRSLRAEICVGCRLIQDVSERQIIEPAGDERTMRAVKRRRV